MSERYWIDAAETERRRQVLDEAYAAIGVTNGVTEVACTVLDGTPIAVTGGFDGTVRVWDLASGRPFGEPLTGHTTGVTDVACTVLDGTPIAVTGGYGNMVRVWNLRTGEAAGFLAIPDRTAVAFSASGDLVVGMGHDVAVFRRSAVRESR